MAAQRNTGDIIPFKFTKIGGFWTRKSDVVIDIVALNEGEGSILFGECKLKGKKFIRNDAQRLREKAAFVKWRSSRMREYYALFSMEDISEAHRKSMEKEEIFGCWSDITYHIRGNEIAENNSKIFPNDYLKSMP